MIFVRIVINRSRFMLVCIWGLVFLFLLAPFTATAAVKGDLLIRNANLVSPERDEPLHNVDVFVQDGYIQEIAEHIENTAGVDVLDASRLYLTPGLIDSHVHVYHATGLKSRYTEDFDVLYGAYLDQAPRSFLYFGYTSVIELNASPDANQRFNSIFGEAIAPDADPNVVGARLETFNTRYERLIKRFSDKGGRLLLGTDTAVGGFGWGSPPGLSGYLEMRDWARAGIPLETIFKAATLDNAKAFGLEDQLGTVEPGKRADLLLFAENPLSDISAYDTIKVVIVGGHPIDRQTLSAASEDGNFAVIENPDIIEVGQKLWILNDMEATVAVEAATSTQDEAAPDATSWVGETTMTGEVTFIRVGPQFFGPPDPFFHRPNELIFNQELQNLTVDGRTISFQVIDGEQTVAYEGRFDGERYNGTAQSKSASGTFFLYPVAASADNSVLRSYAGNYEIGDGMYRTVGFEDLEGFIDTRLYYSDGENLVVMFPLSANDYLNGFGERFRFEQENGVVTGMSISDVNGERTAPKVSLYTEEDVSFESGDAIIAGTLLTPDTPGPHPAVIMAHSSGPGERHSFWMFASPFVRDGLAVLAYDRRGHGASTGGGPFNLNTDILAEDMKAGYAYLQSRPEIDPQRIGLMGFSNGSWVAPRAAQDLPDVAFISVSMASAISQVDAELGRREATLRVDGVSEESIAQAMAANELFFKGAVIPFTDAEAEAFTALYQAIADNEELQNAAGIRLVPTGDMPLEDILATSGSRTYFGFSPTETYLSTEAPISFFLGEFDENIPSELTIAAMEDVIAQRPEADITFVVFPNALHPLFVLPAPVQGMSQDALYPNLASYHFAPGYIEQMRAWLREKNDLN